ncbi:Caffeic acid O-methyltransferase [Quillaja saponaria]|uniref:Caffeic acid O-methyltransferase n=1 Tax=Quillaja saponaria TaxID=32244 RepID=A0AAD7L4F5_QUISA|nr:Caffeic acid O-methyltransferase [Quillaja saponaria]
MATSLEETKMKGQEGEAIVEEEESFSYAMQLATSSVLSFAMQSAIEVGIFDIIAKAGPGAKLSATEIAAQICTNNTEASTMLDRILRLLASYSALNCYLVDDTHGVGSPQRVYSLGPVSKFFVRDADGMSLGPLMAMFQDKIYLESWFQMKEAIVEGGVSFIRVHGTHPFAYAGLDSRFSDLFHNAMINHTTLIIKKTLESYGGFRHLNTLVDVAGGLGVTLNLITSKYPHIKGINFDLPHVIHRAPSYPGVEHVGGDMFESVPHGDAIFMKWILHDWSDEH